jgi:hypothetical protein
MYPSEWQSKKYLRGASEKPVAYMRRVDSKKHVDHALLRESLELAGQYEP